MKQTTIILVMFGSLIIGSLNAQADSGNPFGFETNKHPLEYEFCKKIDLNAVETHSEFDHYSYECSSAPRIHPEVGKYYLTFVEDLGLCFIAAESFRDKVAYSSTEEIVEKFKLQIAKKYGLPAREKDRESRSGYRYDWDHEAGFKGLGNVRAIWLKSRHQGGYYVEVAFHLVSLDACRKKVTDMKYSAF